MSRNFTCDMGCSKVLFSKSEVKISNKEVPNDDAFQTWLERKKDEEQIKKAKRKKELKKENEVKEQARIERATRKEKALKKWFSKKEKKSKEKKSNVEESEYEPKDPRVLIFDSYNPQEVMCRIRECMFKPKTPPLVSVMEKHQKWLKKAFNRKFKVEEYY